MIQHSNGLKEYTVSIWPLPAVSLPGDRRDRTAAVLVRAFSNTYVCVHTYFFFFLT